MVILRRLTVFLCLLTLAIEPSLAQVVATRQSAAPGPKPRKCPDTPIRTIDNKVIRISQYHGKVVMIVLFLTSCQDCLGMLQLMQKLQTDYASRGLQVVAVSLDESSANLLPYQQRYRFPFPMGHLEVNGASELTGVKKDKGVIVPVIMFVDWMGNIRFQYQGNDNFLKDPEKNLRGVATGLLKQAAAGEGPKYETRPAK
jgi:peroxiredoxin